MGTSFSLAWPLAAAVATVVSSPRGTPAQETDPAFKLIVSEPGVYRVDFDALRAAGLETDHVRSDQLRVTHRGRSVPVHVADGGDGRFESGDHVELVAERLEGDRSFHNEFSRTNVYRLETGSAGERMLVPDEGSGPEGAEIQNDVLFTRHHWEEERLRARFRGRNGAESPEPWYWARLTHIDPEPFTHEIDLSRLQWPSSRPVKLRIALRGWSTPRGPSESSLPDHRVEASLNGAPVGSGEWDGQDAHTIEIEGLAAGILQPGSNSLKLRVPRRRPDPGSDQVVDVVLLNWIEIEFPREPALGTSQTVLHLSGETDPGRPIELVTPEPVSLVVYSGGRRLEAERMGPAAAGGWRQRFWPASGEDLLHAVPGGGLLRPLAVDVDRPSALRARSRQADYLIVSHRRLMDAIEPLAAFHRGRGLSVAVVDVEDVYDEFNHGLPHPRAIRDFIALASHQWPRPAPRFVLLVGDASWDPDDEPADERYADWTWRQWERDQFAKNASTPYAVPKARNLLPTWSAETYQGHAASDNWFVSVEGDDHLPDLAVGRFPVTEPAEVAAIVAKTIAYATRSGVGLWRRNILWITNDRPGLQRRSDRLAEQAASLGFADTRVYPRAEEADNVHHQARLREAIDEGHLLVHFVGHGGRYIWRTGPPSHEKNHDLFTLDDLDQLSATPRLPVVLSMTCYSAPFDHPTADSIGEKLLRLEQRGGVAVLAASWRNSPSQEFSRLLVTELTRPTTIGEAVMRAKRRLRKNARLLVETYNLLGDPAIEIAVPGLRLPVDATLTASGWRLRVSLDDPSFHGRAVVDWLDGDGQRLGGTEVEARSPGFDLELPSSSVAAAPVRARVYAWDEERGLDGIGAVRLVAPDGAPASPPRPRARRKW